MAGLLALLLLVDARRAARVDADGAQVLLDDQDRALWDADAIAEGQRLVVPALTGPGVGPYAVQAAIAALHDEAPDLATTDWPQIVALYDVLLRLTPSPLVALNRAMAVAMVDGPAAGLALLDALADAPELRGYHLLPAARAELLTRLGPHGGGGRGLRRRARPRHQRVGARPTRPEAVGASVPRRKSATDLDGPAARRRRCRSGRVRPVRGSDRRLACERLDPPISAAAFRRGTLA